MKLPPTAIASFAPRTPSASLPAGKRPSCVINISEAAASSAAPMPICTLRFGHFATTPAPSQAPATAAAIIEKSVSTSTGITAV